MSPNVKMQVGKVEFDGEFIIQPMKGNKGLKVHSQCSTVDQTELWTKCLDKPCEKVISEHFLTMETRMVLINLLTVIVFSSVVQTFVPPMIPRKLQHQEDIRQRIAEDSAGEQKKIMNFLSIFDEVQKIMKPRLVPTTPGLPDYAKIFGKGVKKDNLDEFHSRPRFSQHKDATESNRKFLRKYPFSGKNFRKTAPQSPKKSKKRACFWKYCVQSK